MAEHGGENRQPMRAQYPEDNQGQMYRSPEDRASYPDMVYQAQNQYPVQTAAGSGSQWAVGGTGRKQRNTAFWAFVAFICAGLLCLMGFLITSIYRIIVLSNRKRPSWGKAALLRACWWTACILAA